MIYIKRDCGGQIPPKSKHHGRRIGRCVMGCWETCVRSGGRRTHYLQVIIKTDRWSCPHTSPCSDSDVHFGTFSREFGFSYQSHRPTVKKTNIIFFFWPVLINTEFKHATYLSETDIFDIWFLLPLLSIILRNFFYFLCVSFFCLIGCQVCDWEVKWKYAIVRKKKKGGRVCVRNVGRGV